MPRKLEAMTGGEKLGFSVPTVAPKARIKYENGGTAQTTFRLKAYKKER